jgi:endo-1,4-beta-xylanase
MPYIPVRTHPAEIGRRMRRLGLILLMSLLPACMTGGYSSGPVSSSIPSLEIHPTPSPTPFQPILPTPAPTPTATAASTRTPTAYQTPLEGETLRTLSDAIGFGIGAPVLNPEARDPSFESVLRSEFNTITLTTFMKKTQPTRDNFDWEYSDAALKHATDGGLAVVGGPLVYSNATAPNWLAFEAADCGSWKPETLEEILRIYVQTVVSRFGGQVSVWEVVNEPLTGSDNCWRRILGEEYIDRAFLYAHQANPDAALMLNEAFGREGVDAELTDRFIALVRRLKDAGIPIDAVGIQMHLSAELLRESYPDEFRYFLSQARRTGVRVMITEMDVYQGADGFFENPFEVQAAVFRTIAQICLETPYCTHFMTWGISDQYTWLSRIKGNTFENPRPLLFDEGYVRKPAYYAVRDALRDALIGGRR